MSFTTDKQTLEDLNLLGKFKQHSIFNIFNNVNTAGAENLLMHMFQHPFTDADAINKRSSIFKYFEEKALTFPFNDKQFELTDNYLSSATSKSAIMSYVSLGWKKLFSMIVKDEEYQNIYIGLSHTINLLRECQSFIQKLDSEESHPFQTEISNAQDILGNPKLKWLDKEQSSQLTFKKVAKYDYLLRQTCRDGLNQLINIFYQLDVYISVANFAKLRCFNYAKAIPKENHIFMAADMGHPAIINAIGNPVSLRKDENMIFLTGANMAGKSTFMKAFAVNAYLAHMGFPVSAKGMMFSVMDGLYTSINVADNLDMGYSHFYAEVLRVKTVAEQVSIGKNLIIVFDELFKGTNVKDAYDATLAVTEAFSEYRNCFFIISTHIVEAGVALNPKENITMLFLPTVMDNNVPKYTYELKPGISADRHGMKIIENEGILGIIASGSEWSTVS